ncbi:hypothetical protein [Streptomyces virginiae]
MTRQCATPTGTQGNVAGYSAVQLASTLAVTRTLGYRVPAAALLTGA